MKAKAILLASVLLVGCHASQQSNVQQHTQSLSAASQGKAGKFTDHADMQDQDLWAYIGDELKMGIPENSRIREQKQNYLSKKSYLHDVTVRAEPYMYWIVEQVKKRNMPMELVLLPIVESAFNPHATSGSDAAGLWQIIPSTGRHYGLKQTRNYDARRDVAASTNAALDMMQRLNNMFDGDWLLTVAAYNCGEGCVMKAIKTNKSRGQSTDFWSLPLPQETKTYVPKMLALSEIFKHSQRYGVHLPTSDDDRALARIRLDGPVSMSQLADMAGMPVSKLKTFNAGVKSSTLGISGPKYVMVPQKHVDQLRESLATTDIANIPVADLPDMPIVNTTPRSTRHYKVRSGDTLSGIASRLGVTTKSLKQWNNIRGNNIKIGQNLTIGSGKNAAKLAKNSSIKYRVRKGDTLWSIAKRHGVNIKDVTRWNRDTSHLQPGDQLTLFVENNNRPDS